MGLEKNIKVSRNFNVSRASHRKFPAPSYSPLSFEKSTVQYSSPDPGNPDNFGPTVALSFTPVIRSLSESLGENQETIRTLRLAV
jgi:hypothetical protein